MSEQQIIISSTLEPATEFLAMAPGIAKRLAYQNQIKNSTYVQHNVLLRNDYVYYSHATFRVKQGAKDVYYVKLQSKAGFTVDPKGKCSVWFKGNLEKMALIPVLRALNIDWILKLTDRPDSSNPFVTLLTPTMLGKVIKGKLTNPIDLCKGYLRSVRIKASPTLLFTLIRQNKGYSHKNTFLKHLYAAKDPNHALEYLIHMSKTQTYAWDTTDPGPDKPHIGIVEDMLDQATILDKKIDYRWSAARMNQEHNNWTAEIMAAEMDTMVDEDTPDHDFYQYECEGFKPLRTKKEVFFEGKVMKHCVYTTYYPAVKAGTYVVYHTSIDGEEATLGVMIHHTGLRIQQHFKAFNAPVSEASRKAAHDFIEDINFRFYPNAKSLDPQPVSNEFLFE